MKKLLLVLALLTASSLPSAEKAQPDTSSWTNKMNTPFFVSVVADKSDYDGLGTAAKNVVEKYLSDSSYRFKTEKDGTAFILEISKTPKDKIEMKIYDASTAEGQRGQGRHKEVRQDHGNLGQDGRVIQGHFSGRILYRHQTH
jgi:hypothetical protein